jgi:hypothetical protein
MSTTQMPFPTVVKSVTDAFTEVLAEATQVTRLSRRAYLKGLDVIVEQHQLAQEGSRQWMAELVSAQSDVANEIVRSYSSSADGLAAAAEDPAGAPEGAVAKLARISTSAGAPSTRKQSTTRKQTTTRRTPRRATSPAATAQLATAVGMGVTTWSSDGYDSLTAAEIVEKLPGFSQQDLREVGIYEQAHQARRTVLERIESLRGAEPVSGYDQLTVPEVQAQLSAGDEALATLVRDYERSHKKRDGVLHATQAQLDKV